MSSWSFAIKSLLRDLRAGELSVLLTAIGGIPWWIKIAINAAGMAPQNVDEDQLRAIIAYFKWLKDNDAEKEPE